MVKLHIAFPDPMMRKLREVSEQQDVPIEEIVLNATEFWLNCYSTQLSNARKKVPIINAGRCLLDPSEIKEALN